jgi:hypothetical protein
MVAVLAPANERQRQAIGDAGPDTGASAVAVTIF